MIRQKRPMTPDKALVKLEELCARSEQCSGEAAKKLRAWGISSADATEIITSLIKRRYIDDRRFASAFVRDKFRFSGWGKLKIRTALAVKRVPRDYIAEALDEIEDEDYLKKLSSIILAKAKTIDDAESYEGRTRLFRFAVSRGYEPDLVANELRRLAGR